ncbi:MAG: uL13 family ribosomal protein, partial [Patescibacteria group bacterium]
SARCARNYIRYHSLIFGMTQHIIDAAKKSVGRVASQAAILLMGKDTPAFRRYIAPNVNVKITHASQAHVHAKKLAQGTHKRYSGYPGGLKTSSWEDVVAKKGYGELFRVAVSGMLPKNKLKAQMLKRLIVEE